MNADNPVTPEGVASPAPEESPRSPGERIRAARERAHLSLDELAAQTKLARHTLEALERDDFHALLEPVYVRGYYRKCAKVLGLPESELIEQYQHKVTPRTPGAPSKLRLASGTELGSANRLPIAMGILLAVIAVAVCAFLWFARGRPEPVPPSVAARAEAITPDPATPVPAPSDALSDPASDALPPEASTSPLAEPVTPMSTDGRMPRAQDAQERLAPAAAPTASVPPAPAPAGAPSAPAASGAPGSVTLSFEGTSWVRIDDAGGKTLLNGLMKAGDSQSVKGALPLNVFLGNAPGVKVEFEGQAVDIARFTRENMTARFTLPAGP